MKSPLSSANPSQPIDARLESIVERAIAGWQSGRPVDVEQLAAESPDCASQLRDLLETAALVARLGNAKQATATPAAAKDNSGAVCPRGQLLGDFRLVRELGRGGMGVVYEAEQLSLGRRVALKVLPFAAIAQEKSLQRFRNEVRAAAALDHPNIVSVYSVGEERGLHYFAMQLVRGQSLADLISELRKLRRHRLPPASSVITESSRAAQTGQGDSQSEGATPAVKANGGSQSTQPVEQALISTAVDSPLATDLFRTAARLGVQAAEALQHAHDQGVLHRDIKPGNLMVDSIGQLYITDFGLARIEADAGMTMTGDLVGTLRYMAPEQALAKRLGIDHRADVYSLGATFYELLTLQPAFSETDRSALLQQIASSEPRPLRKLDPRIPAELETIVLKAMAKQPDERYQTVQGLADDLNAYLEHRPIKAKPPTLVGRAAKWSRRHRALLAWTALVLTMLTVGSLISTAGLLWERQRTKLAAAESKAVMDFLVNDLLASPKDEKKLDREVTVTDVLTNAEAKIATGLVGQPLVEATVRHVLARSYQQLKKFDKAEPHARRALELRTKLAGPEDHDTLEATATMAEVLVGQEKYDEARRLCADAMEVTRRKLGPDHPDTLASMRRMIWLILHDGGRRESDIDSAYQLCQETLDRCRRILGPQDRGTLETMNQMALLLYARGEREQADKLCRETLDTSRRVLGPGDPFTINVVDRLAVLLEGRGQLNEAAQLYQEVLDGQHRILGATDPDTLNTMLRLANTDTALGKYAEACKLCEQAIVASRQLYGADHANVMASKQQLVYALRGLGELDDARELQEEILQWRRRNWGPEDGGTIQAMAELGYVIQLQGNLDQALAQYDETIALSRRVLGPYSSTTLTAMHNRSRVLNKLGRLDEAAEAQKEVLDARRRMVVLGDCDSETLGSMCVLAVIYARQGNLVESQQLIDEAAALLPANEWQVRNSLAWLLATAKWSEIRNGQRALEMATKTCELTGYQAATALDTLAAAQAETGDFKSAVKSCQKAIELAGDAHRVRFAKHLEKFQSGKAWRDE